MILALLAALAAAPQSAPDSALALSQARELVHQYYAAANTQMQQQECHGRGLGDCMEGDWSCVAFVCPNGLASRRSQLIARLEALAPAAGSSEWLFRQRVALAVKAGQPARAVAIADSCDGGAWWCQTLRGFAAHRLSPGDGLAHFDSAFALLRDHPQRSPDGGWAWGLGPDAACTWTDPRAAAPADLLPEAREWSCENGADERARFWWLADPLWTRPGNERLLEHLSRHVMVRMALDVAEDSRRGEEAWMWRDHEDLGPYAIALRQGFPNSRRRMETESSPVPRSNVQGTRRAQPSVRAIRGSAPYVEGGYGFAPDSERFLHPLTSTTDDWTVEWQGVGCASPWTERAHEATGPRESQWLGQVESLEACGQERYITRETWHDLTDEQTAVFRRGGQLLVVSAARPPAGLGPARSLRSGLAVGRLDDLSIRSAAAPMDALGAVRARVLVPDSGQYLASLEVVGPGDVARARCGLPTPPLSDGFGVSDLAIVQERTERDSLPLEDALLPFLDIPADLAVGVYVEVYGLGPDESPDIALKVEDPGGGIFHSLGRVLGLASSPAPLEIRWEEPAGSDEGIRRVLFALDVTNLDGGEHRLSLTIRREDGREARAERRITVR